jgi:hypothetical protein
MLTGYTASDYIVNALVSNFQNFASFVDYPVAQPQFTVHCEVSSVPAAQNPTVIQAIGAFRALTEADERQP